MMFFMYVFCKILENLTYVVDLLICSSMWSTSQQAADIGNSWVLYKPRRRFGNAGVVFCPRWRAAGRPRICGWKDSELAKILLCAGCLRFLDGQFFTHLQYRILYNININRRIQMHTCWGCKGTCENRFRIHTIHYIYMGSYNSTSADLTLNVVWQEKPFKKDVNMGWFSIIAYPDTCVRITHVHDDMMNTFGTL